MIGKIFWPKAVLYQFYLALGAFLHILKCTLHNALCENLFSVHHDYLYEENGFNNLNLWIVNQFPEATILLPARKIAQGYIKSFFEEALEAEL